MSVLAAGVFATEPGQRLLSMLLDFSDRAFESLYKKVHGDTRSPYYKVGVARTPAWQDEVFQEDMAAVANEYPDMYETYAECFDRYAGERWPNGRRRPACPPMLDFIKKYYEHLGRHKDILSGDYFRHQDPVRMRVTCMDATRCALYAVITTESAPVELASEIGVSDDIGPNDSVSQVGRPHMDVRAPSRVAERERLQVVPQEEGTADKGAEAEEAAAREQRATEAEKEAAWENEAEEKRRRRRAEAEEEAAARRRAAVEDAPPSSRRDDEHRTPPVLRRHEYRAPSSGRHDDLRLDDRDQEVHTDRSRTLGDVRDDVRGHVPRHRNENSPSFHRVHSPKRRRDGDSTIDSRHEFVRHDDHRTRAHEPVRCVASSKDSVVSVGVRQ